MPDIFGYADEYEMCYATGNYIDQDCSMCQYNSICSGNPNNDDEDEE